MRSSTIFTAPFVAVAVSAATTMAQMSQISDGQVQAPTTQTAYTNPFTSFLTQTNSLGVVTGMPPVATSQPVPATSETVPVTIQTAAVTSQPTPVTFISGSPGIPDVTSTLVVATPPVVATTPLGTGAASSGFSTALGGGSNATVSTQASPSATGTETGSASASGTGTGTSPSGSAGAGSTTSASASATPSKAAAGMLEPVVGLGVFGAIFALFL